jgi:hypothetical protein
MYTICLYVHNSACHTEFIYTFHLVHTAKSKSVPKGHYKIVGNGNDIHMLSLK